MKNINCPLCRGLNVRSIQKIKIKELSSLYHKEYKEDFAYLFKEEEIGYYLCENCGLKFFYPSVTGDEHFYNVLQGIDSYYLEEKEEYEIAAKYINIKDDVLEIGCGKGAFSKKINCKTYTGLDLSINAKNIASQENIQVINQTIQDHSIFNKGKYDIVCLFQVLEHINCNEIFDFINSAVSCLKIGGYIIISVPSEDSFVSKIINCVLNLPPHHQTRWPDKTLKEIARQFSLKIIELKHDKLSKRNEADYLSVVLSHASINNQRIVNLRPNLLYRLLYHLPLLLSKKARSFITRLIKPNGFSITITYQK